MLHWNADICIQTFTNVAFTTVQWFWLKGAVQIFTDWPAQTTSSTFPLRQSSLWNAAECSSFFLFFFLNLTKSRLVKVEHSILTSHTENVGKNVAVRKRREPGVDCVYSLQKCMSEEWCRSKAAGGNTARGSSKGLKGGQTQWRL